MPSMVPPADVGRLTISGTFESSHWANVFHLYLPGNTLDPDSISTLLEAINDGMTTSLFYAAQANDFAAELMKLDLSDGSTITSGEIPCTLAGTDSSAHVFGASAVVISWLGSWHYRGGKPRTYVGGLTEGWLNEPTVLDSGHVASLQAAAVDTLEGIDGLSTANAPSVSLGVLLGNNATSAGTFAPFTGARVNNYVGSQRRRNRGH